jgi:hypothetical protein
MKWDANDGAYPKKYCTICNMGKPKLPEPTEIAAPLLDPPIWQEM